jgi:DNA-binding beta-propeller fold protein YncE
MKSPCVRLAPRSSPSRWRTSLLLGLALLLARSAFANYYSPIDIKALHGWGSLGTNPGQFRHPTGIATRAGIIYVLDAYNDRVQEFDTNGAFLRAWPLRIGGPFYQLSGIAVDQTNGCVYIFSNYEREPCVLKYSSSGGYLKTWGRSGYLDGQFREITGIAVGPDSNVYTVDKMRSNVQVFNQEGVFLRTWRVGALPTAIAVSQDGFVYVVEAGTSLVAKFDLQGNFQDAWPISIPEPKKIAVSPDGFILLVTGENDVGIELFNSFGISFSSLLVTTLHNASHKLEPKGIAFYSSFGAVVIENRGSTTPDVIKFRVP